MNSNNLLILHGPDSFYGTPKVSLGIEILQCLRKRDCNDIVNIDAETGKALTCGKYIEYSIKLATALKNMGLKHGDAICIFSENNSYYFVIVLAAFYIGVVVSLLNPGYTINELRHGFQFSNAKVIFCSNSAMKNAIRLKEEMNCISQIIRLTEEETLDSSFKNLLDVIQMASVDIESFQPENFDISETNALILLSSGTTGLPKGVLLTHLNVSVTVQSMGDPRYALIKPGDRVLTIIPFFHMFGNLIQFVNLSMPITTIILKKFKPETYLHAIQKHQPSKLVVVPPLVMFLASSLLVDNYNLTSITECLSSGAIVRKEVLRKFKQRFASIEIRQMYGLTECGGFTLIHVPNSKEENIGAPIPNVFIKVRDPETLKLVGPYKSGELCFKGPMIMKGYVGNPNATKDSMDDDGFFCSGDIGYYDEDKNFFIVDRIKEIIRYKCFQVSPTELEQVILTHSNVADCAVIGLPDERSGELPLAFIVKKSDQCLEEEEIINYVAERISFHKRLYGGARFIDEIPRNPSGKILRTKLKELL